MSYAADHASAYADVLAAGAAVTWSKTTPGAHTPSTGTFASPVTTSCAGAAVEDIGDPKEYRELELIERNPATLFFVPATYGELPLIDSVGSWGGATKSVKRIRPIRPDGTAIGMYLVVA